MCDYSNQVLIKTISIPPIMLNNDLDVHIFDKLKNQVEGKCSKEGYIKEGSIKVISKSNGFFAGSLFTGVVNYNVTFSAEVCRPVKGDLINCEVKYINKLGIQAELGSLLIIIAKEFHNDKTIFRNIKQGDKIEIEVIDCKFKKNDKNILIAAKIKDESKFLIDNNNVNLEAKKLNSVKKSIPLSSIDNFNDINIDSIAEEIELDDSEEEDDETGTNNAEIKEIKLSNEINTVNKENFNIEDKEEELDDEESESVEDTDEEELNDEKLIEEDDNNSDEESGEELLENNSDEEDEDENEYFEESDNDSDEQNNEDNIKIIKLDNNDI